MDSLKSTGCDHAGSLYLEAGEGGGFQILCGWCCTQGPEREEPSDAIRAFRELDGSRPASGNAA
jgi:hypothetical protein